MVGGVLVVQAGESFLDVVHTNVEGNGDLPVAICAALKKRLAQQAPVAIALP
jgi:hypothetical protein